MTKFRVIALKVSVFALFIFAFFPVIRMLVGKWANSDDYAHAFLIVPVIAYMVWKKKHLLTRHERKGNLFGLLLSINALFIYIICLKAKIDYGASISMVTAVVGILLYLYDFKLIYNIFIPILLFVLLIPFPGAVYSAITLPLQLKVSQLSEIILQGSSLPIFREGNILSIPGKTFQVVQACSGMRSTMSLITLSLIIGYFKLESKCFKLILVVSSIPIAFIINVFRVVILVIAFHYFKIDLSTGSNHTFLGLMVFIVSLIAIFSAQRILEYWEIKLKKS